MSQPVVVTVFHNVAGMYPVLDHDAISWRYLRGFEAGHAITPVFQFTVDDPKSYLAVCEQAFYLFNVGEDDTALAYRARQLRSLSVGDVVKIECPHEARWFSCEPMGWKPIEPPVENVVMNVRVHGTNSLDNGRV